jgi:hypothetical protein
MEYICHSKEIDAYVEVNYYNSTCVLNEVVYISYNFHLFNIISFIFIYIIFTFIIFYLYITYKYYKMLIAVMTPERNALIAIHPNGYWQTLVQAGNPFRNMFNRN